MTDPATYRSEPLKMTAEEEQAREKLARIYERRGGRESREAAE